MTADRIYDVGSSYTNTSNTTFVGPKIAIPKFMGATKGHHIISASLLSDAFGDTAVFLKELTNEGLFSIKDGTQNQNSITI